jgi:hypothetical protein
MSQICLMIASQGMRQICLMTHLHHETNLAQGVLLLSFFLVLVINK